MAHRERKEIGLFLLRARGLAIEKYSPGWHKTRAGPRFVCFKAPYSSEPLPGFAGAKYNHFINGGTIPEINQVWVARGTRDLFVVCDIFIDERGAKKYKLRPYLPDSFVMSPKEKEDFCKTERVLVYSSLLYGMRSWPEYVAISKRLGLITD